MRFQVGQKVFFIHIDYEKCRPDFSPISLYLPWTDVLKNMLILELECVEHHRVPSEYSDAIEHDGFIFKDKEGRIWNNQYPRYAGSQTSDAADRKVWSGSGNEPYRSMEMLTETLDRVMRGIYEIKKDQDPSRVQKNAEYVTALSTHYDQLVTKMFDEFGLTTVAKNYAYAMADGTTRTLPNYFQFEFIPALKAETT